MRVRNVYRRHDVLCSSWVGFAGVQIKLRSGWKGGMTSERAKWGLCGTWVFGIVELRYTRCWKLEATRKKL
jgi:hypothetical protein